MKASVGDDRGFPAAGPDNRRPADRSGPRGAPRRKAPHRARQRSYSTEYMPPPFCTKRGVPPLANGIVPGIAVS